MKQRMQFTPKKRGIPDPMAQRMVELDALNAMTMVINQSVELDTLLDVAVSQVFQPLGYEQLAIILDTIGNNELTIAASRGLSDFSSILDLGRCVIELENSSERILNLQDLPIENEYVRQSSETSQLIFSIPLIGSSGLLGLILIGNNSNDHLDRETEKLLFSLGRQIAVGLEKVSLIEETQNWAAQLEKRVDQKTATISLVNALNEALNRDDPLENIITQVNQTLQKTFGAVATSIETIDRDQNHFGTGKSHFQEKYFERNNPSQVENNPDSLRIFSHDNLYRDILKSGQPRQFSDPVSILQLTEITTELKLKELGEKTSVYIIPLISKNSPLGLLKILRGTPFNAFEETQLSVISNQFATIIERKLTEEKLMEHDLRYRELYDSAPAAYFAVGTDGLIHRANQGALNLLGYSLEELENRPILDLCANTPAGKNRAKQVFSRFIAGDCIRDEELQMCTADNDYIWISLSIDPVLGDKGDILEGRSIAVDITARKIAERQLHLQSTALEVAANAIAITDTNGTIQWANQAFIDLTDYAREDIGTKNLNLLPSSQHETYPELWAKVKAGEIWSGEITNRRKDSSEYIIEMTITPVEDEDGEITHFIAIKQDISERAHAQKELQRQVEELKALHKFATHGVEIVDEDVLIEMATEIIDEQMGPNNFGVLLVNEQLDVLQHHHSYQRVSESQSYLEIPIGAGITGQVALTGEPLRVADIRTEANYIEAYRDIQSEICVPLRIGERIIGVINAESIIRDRFSKADQRFLSTLAAQLATAIERVRFYNSESKRRQIYETLVQSLDTLNSTLQLDDVLRVILEELSKVLHHDTATVQLQTNGKVEIVSSRGFNYPERVEGLLLPMDLQFPSHKVIENGEPLSVSDIVEDFPSRQDSLYISESEQVRSWLGLPLIVKNNSIGMIAVERTRIDPFLPDDINLAMAFANQAASAIENARLFSEADKRLQRLASLRNIDQAISNSLDPD